MSDTAAAQVIEAARASVERGLVASTVGNVSVRDGHGMLITPTRRHPKDLREDDLVAVRLTGPADAAASTEWRLHATIYRARPDIAAIVHTHSPHAVARSFNPRPLVIETEERTYLDLERIDVARPAPAGSEALAIGAVTALGTVGRAALLARHGVIGTGTEPWTALELCTVVEQQAQIAGLLAVCGHPPAIAP